MIDGCSSSYPVVYRVRQIFIVKIVKPKRDALRSEQAVIVALLASGNGWIVACRVVQQIQGRRVSRINAQAERAQAFEIGFPHPVSQPIRAGRTLTSYLEVAGFDQARQDPLQGQPETRLKRKQPTKLIS